MIKIVALLNNQGTACAETALYGIDDTSEARQRIEAEFCTGKIDAPIAGTWIDVSENEALKVEEDEGKL